MREAIDYFLWENSRRDLNELKYCRAIVLITGDRDFAREIRNIKRYMVGAERGGKQGERLSGLNPPSRLALLRLATFNLLLRVSSVNNMRHSTGPAPNRPLSTPTQAAPASSSATPPLTASSPSSFPRTESASLRSATLEVRLSL